MKWNPTALKATDCLKDLSLLGIVTAAAVQLFFKVYISRQVYLFYLQNVYVLKPIMTKMSFYLYTYIHHIPSLQHCFHLNSVGLCQQCQNNGALAHFWVF